MSGEVEDFYGPWQLRVATKDAWLDQQVRITGSDAADGSYPGVPGTSFSVTGDHWQLTMDWRDPAGGPWSPSRIRRLASYSNDDGLVLTLGADDGPPETSDGDFNDMTVTAQYLDRTLDPPQAWDNLFDFTVTENMVQEQP